MDKSADESVIERNTINKKESNKIDFSQQPFSEDCEKYFLFYLTLEELLMFHRIY